MIFGQGTRHFHFAVGTDHYGPILLFVIFCLLVPFEFELRRYCLKKKTHTLKSKYHKGLKLRKTIFIMLRTFRSAH